MVTYSVSDPLPRVDVAAQAGRLLEVTVTVLDGDGAPVLAAAIQSARAHVRASVDSTVILHVFGSDEDPPNIDITDTGLVITATAAETSEWQLLWPSLTVWWDVEITDTDDLRSQLTAPSTITLAPEVTR
jgi:hypothetical protein